VQLRQQILKGIEFVESFSRKQTYLKAYAADFLFFFIHIANSTDDHELGQLALLKGGKVARRWRKFQTVPRKTTALIHTIIAEQAAHDLGCIDLEFRERLQSKLTLERVIEMLGFDPSKQAPPADLTDDCQHCNYENLGNRVFCFSCRKKLDKLSRYDVWLNAIVVTHHLNIHQMVGGHLFKSTLKWMDKMRPYPTENISLQDEAWEASYAITHVIYALTNYSLRQVKPTGLKAEFAHLKKACRQARECGDLDLLGECIDGLRSFSQSSDLALIDSSIRYMLGCQNSDGSWGDIKHPAHRRMHTTWTVIDAIRSYSWKEPPVSLNDFR
jgi:hypothetical protein